MFLLINFYLIDRKKEYDCALKLAVVGPRGVGKSSLLHRYVNDRFTYNGKPPTIEVDYGKYI